MSNDIFIERPVVIETTEQVGMTLKEMSIRMGDDNTTYAVSIILGHRDENGNWKPEVQPFTYLIEDQPASENPMEQHAAQAMCEALFAALLPATPLTQLYDVVGETVWDGAKTMISQQLTTQGGEP